MSHQKHDKHHEQHHHQEPGGGKKPEESFGTQDTNAEEEKEWMDGMSDDE